MPQPGAPGSEWRGIFEKHQTALAADLSQFLETSVRDAVAAAVLEERSHAGRRTARACEEARRSQAESLNQALRRLRLANTERASLEILNETCTPWAERAVVMVFSGDSDGQTHGDLVAGHSLMVRDLFNFPLSSAPALTSAIDSREPLVVIASGDQISPALVAAFGGEGDPDADPGTDEDRGARKAWLFPLVVREAAAAMLVACGTVDAAQVELLCEAAAMRMEILTAPAAVPQKPAPATSGAAWQDLTPEDQALHLQAQRMARVRVAEIRLDEDDAMRRGQAGTGVYLALQNLIDAARREFLQSYLSKSPTMVDYLHLELVRTLAAGDPKLLGTGYPGPLV